MTYTDQEIIEAERAFDPYDVKSRLGGTVRQTAKGLNWLGPGPGHSRHDNSLSATKTPDGVVLVHSFAGDDLEECRAHIGLPPKPARRSKRRGPMRRTTRRKSAYAAGGAAQGDDEERLKRARYLWDQTDPADRTLVEYYLRDHRGLRVPLPDDVRFDPRYQASPDPHDTRPAMVCAMRDIDGNVTAVQVTLLDPETAGKCSRFPKPRTRGFPTGSAVRLGEVPEHGVLVVAEGVVTALSFTQLFGIPSWAAGGTSGFASFPVPSGVRALVIAADRGGPGQRAAQELKDRLTREGMRVEIFTPDHVKSDWNDVLRECPTSNEVDATRERLERFIAEICEQESAATSAGSAEAPRPERLPPLADARDGAFGNFPLTELGTAKRLLARHGQDLRFVPELKSWLVWENDHWAWDRDGARVRTRITSLIAEIYGESENVQWAEAAHFIKWARKCQTAEVIKRVVSLAADQEVARLNLASVDGDPLLIGFDGARQVIDLRTGQVRLARRSDLVTRSLRPSKLGTASRARRWTQFLEEVFQGDRQVIEWLRRFLGYCLTGLNREHLFVFAYGNGANGKSKFLNACKYIWGEYARTIQAETIEAQVRAGSGPSPDLARLIGARLVLGAESEEDRRLAEGLIKQLTGGDAVTARSLYKEPIEFEPTFKMMFAGNHRPRITGTDGGIWRRMRLLPFNRKFEPHERDANLEETLQAEADDILAWVVEGCRKYLESGLGDIPTSIYEATEAYRKEQDVVGLWLDERTDPVGQCRSGVLYTDFKAWCGDNGHVAMSGKAFAQRLAERGLKGRHGRNGTMYAGVSLRFRT